METIGSWELWVGFVVVVLIMLCIDLFVVGGGRQHRVSVKEAAIWSMAWLTLSATFAAVLWWYLDGVASREVANAKSLEFVTGYLIEKALAIDNVFVWLMLFSYFAVPPELQKRVLLCGVIGAIVMRTIMIFAGAWLIAQFHWILYLFGLFLLITGIKMFWFADVAPDLDNNKLVKWLRSHMNISTEFQGEKFFIRKNGIRYATPLFLALVLVELSDLIFAVDSIPAIFAITTDPFIVLTSNIFAILGLRAMYFLLAGVADKFSLLKYGLAAVLMFIGVKMLLIDIYKIPIGFSLAVVAVFIGASMWASLLKDAQRKRDT
jgi:tellurite resistance protein TerC